jgi:hypothetical protein
VLAVTAQNPGPDGSWGTTDDLLAPINANPCNVSIDFTPGPGCSDPSDRVRNFIGGHPSLAIFAHADGSVLAVNESLDGQLFRKMGTMDDRDADASFGP